MSYIDEVDGRVDTYLEFVADVQAMGANREEAVAGSQAGAFSGYEDLANPKRLYAEMVAVCVALAWRVMEMEKQR